jgi:hypothetical protein
MAAMPASVNRQQIAQRQAAIEGQRQQFVAQQRLPATQSTQGQQPQGALTLDQQRMQAEAAGNLSSLNSVNQRQWAQQARPKSAAQVTGLGAGAPSQGYIAAQQGSTGGLQGYQNAQEQAARRNTRRNTAQNPYVSTAARNALGAGQSRY